MDRNLLTLLTLAETGSLTAAADRLHITQPTLTKRLQVLEERHNCRLFERLPRGVRLTAYGERLLPHARRIEHEYLQADEAIRAVRSGFLDELRVGAGPLFHMRYLAPAFGRLRKEYPETALSLTSDVNTVTIPKLRDGRLHLTFGTTEHLASDDQIAFRALTRVEQGFVLRKSHPLAGRERIHGQELGDVSWIAYSETKENEEMLRAHFESRGGVPPSWILQSSSMLLAFQMVAGGDYAMMLPVQLRPVLAGFDLTVIAADPPIGAKEAGAYVRRSSMGYPIVNRLVEIVAEDALAPA